MDELPLPGGRADEDAPGSPKRKKVRAKYAPKACVACRRSKLKCSGENPCHRCLDNGRRCFYSEDQTAAEALQNLSRPTPVLAPSLSTNGNGARRSILPRGDVIERRASDASVLGSISMEARMARIENMMETLIQDRGIGITPRGSIEREEAANDSFSEHHMETYGTSLVPGSQRPSFSQASPESRPRHSISMASPTTSSVEPVATIRVGSRNLPFPSPSDYQKYINFFLADVNPCHPCVNEAEFRARGEQMLVSRVIHATEVTFLALNYIVFACIDIMVDTTPPGVNSKPAGWHWFQTAEELVGKMKLSGRGDLSLVQFLIWEAIYLSCADQPNAAYNAIGLACRLCFQFGLHQQPNWRNYTPFEIHMRQRIFWTVFFTDRRIALSCGRPYGIRDLDYDVEQPSWIADRDLHPDHPLPTQDPQRSSNPFLSCMIAWGKLVGEVWDHVFAPGAAKHREEGENTAVLDARIKHYTEVTQPTIPLLPSDFSPEPRHLKQLALVQTRFNHLRLLLRRRAMTSLRYDGTTGRICGDLAMDTVQRIKDHSHEAKLPSSFRFHMTATLGGAILILSTLLVRDLGSIGLQDKAPVYAESFRDAIGILHDIAIYFQAARRVADDCKDIVRVVTTILNGGPPDLIPTNLIELFPYNALDCTQQSGLPDTGGWNGADVANLDSWDFELQPSGNGVPWI